MPCDCTRAARPCFSFVRLDAGVVQNLMCHMATFRLLCQILTLYALHLILSKALLKRNRVVGLVRYIKTVLYSLQVALRSCYYHIRSSRSATDNRCAPATIRCSRSATDIRHARAATSSSRSATCSRSTQQERDESLSGSYCNE